MNFLRRYMESKWFRQTGVPEEQLVSRFEAKLRNDRWGLRLLDSILEVRAELTGADWVIEKTPGMYEHAELLLERYPRCRVVFMWRDPRAVVASLLKAPWATDEWMLHAYRWMKCSRIYQRLKEHGRVRCIRYEDLILARAEVLRKLLEWLDLRPGRAAAAGGPRLPDRASNGTAWDRDHYRKALGRPDASRLTAWREELPEGVAADVELLCRKGMEYLGYELTVRSVGAFVRSSILRGLLLSRRIAWKNGFAASAGNSR